MSVYEDALKLIEKHKSLTDDLEKLQIKIEKEEEKIYPLLIDLIDHLTPEEFSKVYHNIEDSDLKYRLFIYIKNKSK